MNLRGIDIANYQKTLDITKIVADFVIIKVSEGTHYVNPSFEKHYKQASQSNKLIGFYHYSNGKDAKSEADYFLKNIGSKIGTGILCLDWEGQNNSLFGRGKDVSWCRAFADRIYEKTGIRIFIYMSKSVCREHNWSAVAVNCYLWVAQYKNYNKTGYQTNPWTDSKGYGAWKSPTIFQYTSSGRLNNYSGNLDLDIAYISKEQWKEYATSTKNKTTTTTTTKKESQNTSKNATKDISFLAVEVIRGKHGSGNERKKSLGSKYDEVQALVNYYLSSNGHSDYITACAKYVLDGRAGNGEQRKKFFGSDYKEVQNRVNQLLK